MNNNLKEISLDSFRVKVCEKNYEILGEEDYKSLSIGYFLGLGLDIDMSIELASKARYTHNYWANG